MDIIKLSAMEMREKLINRELTAREITKAHLNRIEEMDRLNSFITITEEEALVAADDLDRRIKRGEEVGILAGIPIGIKDNIITKDIKTTCGSKMLEGFIPPYEASVIEKIKDADGIILGKTNMDEFAAGYTTETSYFGPAKNPIDEERTPGGSSGGSAAAIRSNQLALALATDTGGSSRLPASYCGIVGIKPTYGLISRYGLVPLANSMDQIGCFARDVMDASLMLGAIAGRDEKDPSSIPINRLDYLDGLKSGIKDMKIGLPREYMDMDMDKRVKDKLMGAVKIFEDLGGKVEEVSLAHAWYAWMSYYLLAVSEISSNMARYDGIRYGHRVDAYKTLEELYFKSRTEGFGEDLQRIIMAGTYILSSKEGRGYYDKALKTKALVKEDLDKVFSQYDIILTPTSPNLPFRIGDKTAAETYNLSIFNVPANLAGICALSIPCGWAEGLPIGLQIMGDRFKEENILKAAYALERELEAGGER